MTYRFLNLFCIKNIRIVPKELVRRKDFFHRSWMPVHNQHIIQLFDVNFNSHPDSELQFVTRKNKLFYVRTPLHVAQQRLTTEKINFQ